MRRQQSYFAPSLQKSARSVQGHIETVTCHLGVNYCYPSHLMSVNMLESGVDSWPTTQVPYNHDRHEERMGWQAAKVDHMVARTPYWPRGPGMPSPDKHWDPHWPGNLEGCFGIPKRDLASVRQMMVLGWLFVMNCSGKLTSVCSSF
jgi:hypothetical protein